MDKFKFDTTEIDSINRFYNMSDNFLKVFQEYKNYHTKIGVKIIKWEHHSLQHFFRVIESKGFQEITKISAEDILKASEELRMNIDKKIIPSGIPVGRLKNKLLKI